jgi:hypothetical protein
MRDRCGLPGTLHVSLPTDIIQLFGTSGVPAIVAGSVFFVFELGERFASQRAKDAVSKWLVSFDVRKAAALPEGTHSGQSAQWPPRWRLLRPLQLFSCLPKSPG